MQFKFEPKQLFCPSCNQPMHWNGKSDRQYSCVQPNCERKGKAVSLPAIEIEVAD